MSAIESDWRVAGLSEARFAMLNYAVKLTESPAEMVAADVERLRSAGFSDRDVLDINELTAYFAYANRIADGLGIELESWIPED